MKTDTVFKKAFNDALDLVSKLKHCEPLPSENVLGTRLAVSRTTVRKVLSKFSEAGLIAGSGAQRTVRLTHPQVPRFPDAETIPMANQVERLFMEWTLRDNMSPGALINELDLARRFRGSDHQHSGVLESFPSLRTHRETAECGLGVQRLHRQLCAGAFRDTRDVRAAVGKGVLRPARRLSSLGGA